MRGHTQRGPEIFGQRANVSAFAAADPYRDAHLITGLKGQKLKAINFHRPGGSFYLLPRTGTLVERLAVNLQCRVHGRHLLDSPGQRCHRLCHCIFRKVDGGGLGDHRAIGVGGVGAHTEHKGTLVPFVSVQ